MNDRLGPASTIRLREALPPLADAALAAALEAIPGAAVLYDAHRRAIVRANSRARTRQAEEGAAFDAAVAASAAEMRVAGAPPPRFERTLVRSASGTHVLLVDSSTGDELVLRMIRFARAWRLTPRCREVLALVVRGEPNRAIAQQLGLAERTVEVHLTTIFTRAAVSSRAALIATFWEARRAG
jgi:DNA-binding NarL/FixJ family response regulator